MGRARIGQLSHVATSLGSAPTATAEICCSTASLTVGQGTRIASDTGTITVVVPFKRAEVAHVRSTNCCGAVAFSGCYNDWNSSHASKPHRNDSTGMSTSHEGAGDLGKEQSSQTVERPAELKAL